MTIYGQPAYLLEERHCCVKKKKKKKKKEKEKLHDQERPNQTSYGYKIESNCADGKEHKIVPAKGTQNRTGREKYFSMLERCLDFWR